MKKLTSKQTKEIFKACAKKYEFQIVTRDTSEFDEIADALAGLGFRQPATFLDKYSFTVGHLVWIPYAIGHGDHLGRIRQVCNILHESRHVGMTVREMVQYLFNRTKRAGFEHEPLAVTMECYHLLTGEVLIPGQLARGLRPYRVDTGDIQTAEDFLTRRAKRVELGQYRSGQARFLRGLLV